MPERSMDIAELIGSYLDETLSAEDAVTLLQLIKSNEFIHQHFISSCIMHHQLKEMTFNHQAVAVNKTEFVFPLVGSDTVSNQTIDVGFKPVVSRPVFDFFKSLIWWKKINDSYWIPDRYYLSPFVPVVVLGIIIVCWMFIPSLVQKIPNIFSEMVPQANTNQELIQWTDVCRVAEVVDPVWSANTETFKRGEGFEKGHIQLTSGLIRLEFDNGTGVILEGPADFLINGSKNTFCHFGKLTVQVSPQGKGFEVTTPFSTIVDHGTEFFVDVDKNEMKVDVIKGLVDVVQNQKHENLTSGDRFQVGTLTKPNRTTFRSSAYMAMDRFLIRLNDYTERLTRQQEEKELQLNEDPDLLARFVFGRSSDNQIPNLAAATRSTIASANLSQTSLCSGRLNGEKAVNLEKPNMKIVLPLGDNYRQLRIKMVAKLNAIQNDGNILLASENHLKTPGSIIWQILPSGQLQVQYRESSGKIQYYTSNALSIKKLRTWTEYQLKFDPVRKAVSMFVDDERVLFKSWTNVQPVFLGNMTIGGASSSLKSNTNRYLNGSVQEINLWK